MHCTADSYSIAGDIFHALSNLSNIAVPGDMEVQRLEARFMHPIDGEVILDGFGYFTSTESLPSTLLAENSAALTSSAQQTKMTVQTIGATASSILAASIVFGVGSSVAAAFTSSVSVSATSSLAGTTTGSAGASGGGVSTGSAAADAIMLLMGAQRLSLTSGLAVEMSPLQSGIASSVGWTNGNLGVFASEYAAKPESLGSEWVPLLSRPTYGSMVTSASLSAALAKGRKVFGRTEVENFGVDLEYLARDSYVDVNGTFYRPTAAWSLVAGADPSAKSRGGDGRNDALQANLVASTLFSAPIGTQWLRLSSAPSSGVEVQANPALAQALSLGRSIFSTVELDAFGLLELRADSFVNANGVFHQPCSAWTSRKAWIVAADSTMRDCYNPSARHFRPLLTGSMLSSIPVCSAPAPPPLGSGWIPLLATPATGNELIHPQLTDALQKGKKVFFRDELRELGLTNLTSSDYVFAGQYYRPSTDVRAAATADGRARQNTDGSLPETLGSEWIPLLSIPVSGEELTNTQLLTQLSQGRRVFALTELEQLGISTLAANNFIVVNGTAYQPYAAFPSVGMQRTDWKRGTVAGAVTGTLGGIAAADDTAGADKTSSSPSNSVASSSLLGTQWIKLSARPSQGTEVFNSALAIRLAAGTTVFSEAELEDLRVTSLHADNFVSDGNGLYYQPGEAWTSRLAWKAAATAASTTAPLGSGWVQLLAEPAAGSSARISNTQLTGALEKGKRIFFRDELTSIGLATGTLSMNHYAEAGGNFYRPYASDRAKGFATGMAMPMAANLQQETFGTEWLPLLSMPSTGSELLNSQLTAALALGNTVLTQDVFTSLKLSPQLLHDSYVRANGMYYIASDAFAADSASTNTSARLGSQWIALADVPSAGTEKNNSLLSRLLSTNKTTLGNLEIDLFGLDGLRTDEYVNVNGVYYQPSSAWTSREAWSTAPGASSISAPLGSGWVPLLARPLSGTELTSPQLKAALAAGKQVFFRNELEQLGLDNITHDSYTEAAGGVFYRPSTDARAAGLADGRVAAQTEGGIPEALGSSWIMLLSRPAVGVELKNEPLKSALIAGKTVFSQAELKGVPSSETASASPGALVGIGQQPSLGIVEVRRDAFILANGVYYQPHSAFPSVNVTASSSQLGTRWIKLSSRPSLGREIANLALASRLDANAFVFGEAELNRFHLDDLRPNDFISAASSNTYYQPAEAWTSVEAWTVPMSAHSVTAPLGSSWVQLLAEPAAGTMTQITNVELSSALSTGKRLFFRSELEELGLQRLSEDSYVESGGSYYRPSTDTRAAGAADGRVALNADGSLPESLGSEWVPLLRRPSVGTELANAQLAAALATGHTFFSQTQLATFNLELSQESYIVANGICYQPREVYIPSKASGQRLRSSLSSVFTKGSTDTATTSSSASAGSPLSSSPLGSSWLELLSKPSGGQPFTHDALRAALAQGNTIFGAQQLAELDLPIITPAMYIEAGGKYYQASQAWTSRDAWNVELKYSTLVAPLGSRWIPLLAEPADGVGTRLDSPLLAAAILANKTVFFRSELQQIGLNNRNPGVLTEDHFIQAGPGRFFRPSTDERAIGKADGRASLEPGASIVEGLGSEWIPLMFKPSTGTEIINARLTHALDSGATVFDQDTLMRNFSVNALTPDNFINANGIFFQPIVGINVKRTRIGSYWIELGWQPLRGEKFEHEMLERRLSEGRIVCSDAELTELGMAELTDNSYVKASGRFYQPSSAWTSREAWSTAPGASSISAPLGSGWVPLLARPLSGTELTSPQLKAALAAGKQVFFRNELEQLGLTRVEHSAYVQAGGVFYRPSTDARAAGLADGRAPMQVDGMPPETLGSEWLPLLSRPLTGAELHSTLLRDALASGKVLYARSELATLNVSTLTPDNFINVSGTAYQPVAAFPLLSSDSASPLGSKWIRLAGPPATGSPSQDSALRASIGAGQTVLSPKALSRLGVKYLAKDSFVHVHGFFYQPAEAWTSVEAWTVPMSAHSVTAPLGSSWVQLLAEPAAGTMTQITNVELSSALSTGKRLFFRSELEELGLQRLSEDSYVESGGSYYRPSTDTRAAGAADGRVALNADGSLPESLGSEWVPLLRRPSVGTELANAQLAAALSTGKTIFSQQDVSQLGLKGLTTDTFTSVLSRKNASVITYYQVAMAFPKIGTNAAAAPLGSQWIKIEEPASGKPLNNPAIQRALASGQTVFSEKEVSELGMQLNAAHSDTFILAAGSAYVPAEAWSTSTPVRTPSAGQDEMQVSPIGSKWRPLPGRPLEGTQINNSKLIDALSGGKTSFSALELMELGVELYSDSWIELGTQYMMATVDNGMTGKRVQPSVYFALIDTLIAVALTLGLAVSIHITVHTMWSRCSNRKYYEQKKERDLKRANRASMGVDTVSAATSPPASPPLSPPSMSTSQQDDEDEDENEMASRQIAEAVARARDKSQTKVQFAEERSKRFAEERSKLKRNMEEPSWYHSVGPDNTISFKVYPGAVVFPNIYIVILKLFASGFGFQRAFKIALLRDHQGCKHSVPVAWLGRRLYCPTAFVCSAGS